MKEGIIQLVNRVKELPPVPCHRVAWEYELASYLEEGLSIKGSMSSIQVMPKIVFPCFTMMGDPDKVEQAIKELSGLFAKHRLTFHWAVNVDPGMCPEVAAMEQMIWETVGGRFIRYVLNDDIPQALALHRRLEARLGPPSNNVWSCLYTLAYLDETDPLA